MLKNKFGSSNSVYTNAQIVLIFVSLLQAIPSSALDASIYIR
jgi:hypothetical protein